MAHQHMLLVALVLGALLLPRAPAADALMANMTSEVVCGYMDGGPNRLMGCGVAGGRMVDCHNSAQILGDGGRLNIQCRGPFLASGGPGDPYVVRFTTLLVGPPARTTSHPTTSREACLSSCVADGGTLCAWCFTLQALHEATSLLPDKGAPWILTPLSFCCLC